MLIQEVQLFQKVPSHIMEEIALLAVEKNYSAGSEVFRAGDFADSLCILEEGEIEITLPGEGRIFFPVKESGLVFGWSALIEPRQYTASARCLKNSKVIEIDGDRLMGVLEKHPADGLRIMERLAGVIASRLMHCYQRLTMEFSDYHS
jgi:CRP-like cAMP-binding protein